MALLNKNIFSRFSFKYFQKNSRLIFWTLIFLLLLAEGFVVYDSVGYILRANAVPEAAAPVHNAGVRINFENYQKAITRFKAADNFSPDVGNIKNPFAPISISSTVK